MSRESVGTANWFWPNCGGEHKASNLPDNVGFIFQCKHLSLRVGFGVVFYLSKLRQPKESKNNLNVHRRNLLGLVQTFFMKKVGPVICKSKCDLLKSDHIWIYFGNFPITICDHLCTLREKKILFYSPKNIYNCN